MPLYKIRLPGRPGARDLCAIGMKICHKHMTVQFQSHFKSLTVKNVAGMPDFEIISGKCNVQQVSVEIMNRTVLVSN